jgi:hypothetical protein
VLFSQKKSFKQCTVRSFPLFLHVARNTRPDIQRLSALSMSQFEAKPRLSSSHERKAKLSDVDIQTQAAPEDPNPTTDDNDGTSDGKNTKYSNNAIKEALATGNEDEGGELEGLDNETELDRRDSTNSFYADNLDDDADIYPTKNEASDSSHNDMSTLLSTPLMTVHAGSQQGRGPVRDASLASIDTQFFGDFTFKNVDVLGEACRNKDKKLKSSKLSSIPMEKSTQNTPSPSPPLSKQSTSLNIETTNFTMAMPAASPISGFGALFSGVIMQTKPRSPSDATKPVTSPAGDGVNTSSSTLSVTQGAKTRERSWSGGSAMPSSSSSSLKPDFIVTAKDSTENDNGKGGGTGTVSQALNWVRKPSTVGGTAVSFFRFRSRSGGNTDVATSAQDALQQQQQASLFTPRSSTPTSQGDQALPSTPTTGTGAGDIPFTISKQNSVCSCSSSNGNLIDEFPTVKRAASQQEVE